MNDAPKIEISVIITAHDRKEYLIGAINSVVSNTLDRDRYEVIVVKNFSDEDIDNYIRDVGALNILTEERNFGKKLALGIERSLGGIIMFLDDDDEFSPSKLEFVRDAFSMDSEVIYVHNGNNVMDGNGNIFRHGRSGKEVSLELPLDDVRKLSIVSRMRADWYSSCISINSIVARQNLNIISNALASLDRFMFLICLGSSGKMKFLPEPLTNYRLHKSTTGIISPYKKYCREKEDFFNRTMESLLSFANLVGNDHAVVEYLKIQEAHNRLNYFLHKRERQLRLRAQTIFYGLRGGAILRDRILMFLSLYNALGMVSPKIMSYLHYLYERRPLVHSG